MSKIRKLYFYDKKQVLEMISFLNNSADDYYVNYIMFNPLILLHHLVPLKYKFLPESYIYKDGKEIKGLITIAPQKGLNKKVEIKKLFFEENALDAAAELVQYAVSRYKAIGCPSILVKVDNYLPELLNMFTTKCGFSQISNEKLWRVKEFPQAEYDKEEFRTFRNSDAKAVTEIYNDSLLPHFRPLLNCGESEFQEPIFSGLSYYSEYKYTIIDKTTGNINGCLFILTSDDENYVLDIMLNGCVNYDINSLITFASDKIRLRSKRFGLFVRSKKYTNSGEEFEKIFAENGYECVQNQVVLTNSSARVLRSEENAHKYTVLNDFCPSSAVSAG